MIKISTKKLYVVVLLGRRHLKVIGKRIDVGVYTVRNILNQYTYVTKEMLDTSHDSIGIVITYKAGVGFFFPRVKG